MDDVVAVTLKLLFMCLWAYVLTDQRRASAPLETLIIGKPPNMGEEQYALLKTEPLTSTNVILFHQKKNLNIPIAILLSRNLATVNEL